MFYMDMLPNVILDPEKASMVTTGELQKVIPAFDWTGGHAGRLLAKEDAIKLESMWSDFLAEHSENADGITMNVINRIN